MKDKAKYSRSRLLGNVGAGMFLGGLSGIIDGIIGSLSVPSSVRKINNELDESLEDYFEKNEMNIYNKVGSVTGFCVDLLTKSGIQGIAMYRMIEDIVNGGDISYGLLAIPNLISAGYELRRHLKKEDSELLNI